MGVCKCIIPLQHGGTPSSRRAASSFAQWLSGSLSLFLATCRGSNPGLGEVDPAIHPFSGLISDLQACWGTNTGGRQSDRSPDRNIC
ncbi:hypothetical protein TNCV_3059461 [Trichonephila clavipes]|nr:hypothetical protein TNCV_3059461 [Trichonephila clavipes]